MKKQIAFWAGRAGRELLVVLVFACSVLLWIFGRMRSTSLKDLALIAWIAVSIVISVRIIQDLSRDVVTIEPISTPKAFAEGGYTPEVASRHLHDALNNYAENAGSMMRMHVAQSNDLPDFVVPKLDLSLNAIVTSIRSALHYRDSQRITGEFTQQGKLSLRVRVDGHEVYNGSTDRNDPDVLLAEAAPEIMDKIRPYLVASAMYSRDPAGAVEKADEIIARFGESDVNTQWAYLLKSNALSGDEKFDQAEKLDRKAIELGSNNWVAHHNLGHDLVSQGKLDEAIVQFERAIAIDRSAALPRCSLARVLIIKAGSGDKLENAVATCRNALNADPRSSLSHLALGELLRERGESDAAIAEYRKAIKFAPLHDQASATYHFGLANALQQKAGTDGQRDEAIVEYRTAIKLASDKEPNLAMYHYNLAVALGESAKGEDKVIDEYKRAIAIKPKYSFAHNNLGVIWQNQGKLEDAIREFREAVADDPNNKPARENLDATLKLQQDKVAKK